MHCFTMMHVSIVVNVHRYISTRKYISSGISSSSFQTSTSQKHRPKIHTNSNSLYVQRIYFAKRLLAILLIFFNLTCLQPVEKLTLAVSFRRTFRTVLHARLFSSLPPNVKCVSVPLQVPKICFSTSADRSFPRLPPDGATDAIGVSSAAIIISYQATAARRVDDALRRHRRAVTAEGPPEVELIYVRRPRISTPQRRPRQQPRRLADALRGEEPS